MDVGCSVLDQRYCPWEGKALEIVNSDLTVFFIFYQFPKLGKFRTPKVLITHH